MVEGSQGLVVLVAIGVAVGAVGTVVPVLPGLSLVWVATLVYGLVEGFGTVGVVAFAVITLLAAAGIAAGWVVPQRAAGRAGAARSSILLGVVGAIVGFFALPIVGAPVGGLLGLYLGERHRTRNPASAWRATRATVIGFGLATLAQFAAALAMAATWLAWLIVR